MTAKRLPKYHRINFSSTSGRYAIGEGIALCLVGVAFCYFAWMLGTWWAWIFPITTFLFGAHSLNRARITLRDRSRRNHPMWQRREDKWEEDWRYSRSVASDRERRRRRVYWIALVCALPVFAVNRLVLVPGPRFDWFAALVAGFVFVLGFRHFERWRRFGSPRLEFADFPFRLGQPLRATLRIPRGAQTLRRLKVTLRHIEEVSVGGGGGAEEAVEVGVLERHATSAEIGGRIRAEVPIEIVPPHAASPTRLAPEYAAFWELEVTSPGWTGMRARFLVPVY